MIGLYQGYGINIWSVRYNSGVFTSSLTLSYSSQIVDIAVNFREIDLVDSLENEYIITVILAEP